MARCGDCLYYPTCKNYVDENESFPEVGGCKAFKDKADFVEVIRCKDCKCYKEYLHHSTKEPTGWGKCTKIEMDIDLAANDFCSYGERTQRKEG